MDDCQVSRLGIPHVYDLYTQGSLRRSAEDSNATGQLQIMNLVWQRVEHALSTKDFVCWISSVTSGPLSLSPGFVLQLLINRCIQAPIRRTLNRSYLSSNWSNLSLSMDVTARISHCTFASALVSAVASEATSAGHSERLLSHVGPSVHK